MLWMYFLVYIIGVVSILWSHDALHMATLRQFAEKFRELVDELSVYIQPCRFPMELVAKVCNIAERRSGILRHTSPFTGWTNAPRPSNTTRLYNAPRLSNVSRLSNARFSSTSHFSNALHLNIASHLNIPPHRNTPHLSNAPLLKMPPHLNNAPHLNISPRLRNAPCLNMPPHLNNTPHLNNSPHLLNAPYLNMPPHPNSPKLAPRPTWKTITSRCPYHGSQSSAFSKYLIKP